ncbi:hypothetical protein VTK73DRAFT_5361 [Phialemonium thermophilum]|uniref:PHD-type domain-containing protein n=1 Tax=Phialemonium thermophilum TaxID=223376 RepID=A0ABR3Y8I4_9PEZI
MAFTTSNFVLDPAVETSSPLMSKGTMDDRDSSNETDRKQNFTQQSTLPDALQLVKTEESQGLDGASTPQAHSAGTKKKRGTASVTRATKRGKAGPKKSKFAARKKKTDSDVRRGAVPALEEDLGEQEEDGGSSESDGGPYCICRGPDNHRFMIACDKCEDWFHGDCIGMDKYTGENLVQRYICPNCTDGKMYVTRYKKTCALRGCEKPARIYDEKDSSVFCCDDHCQTWWQQLVATLPESKKGYGSDILTQEEFMGLMVGSAGESVNRFGVWKLGDDPFCVPADFWDTVPAHEVLSEEERALLSRSAQERHRLGEEIVLCKKMLQLIDMAVKRREAAIAAYSSLAAANNKSQQAPLGKDFCGYDTRLDSVGVTHAFAAFVKSPLGEAIFRAGKLDAPTSLTESTAAEGSPEVIRDAGDAVTAGMCTKKKCKPHMQWASVLTKTVKHQIKELAALAKEKLDAEARVRDCAAVRYRRRLRENHAVTIFESDTEMETA